MFEGLKNNLQQEKRLVDEMKKFDEGLARNSSNPQFYIDSLNVLKRQMFVLNAAVPELLKKDFPFVDSSQPAPAPAVQPQVAPSVPPVAQPQKSGVVNVSYVSPNTKQKHYLSVNKKDKEEILSKLKLSEEAISGLKKADVKRVDSVRKPNPYAVFSSKYFRKHSDKMLTNFSSLNKDLKKANMSILLSSYLSMAMMSMSIAFVFGLFLFVGLLVISLSNWYFFFLPFGFTGLVMAGFYFYPSSEASSVEKNISFELPFATIYMAAIAGSNIAPVKIFKIIMGSAEYVNVGAEIRKVITQIEVYGYDIVTALKNVSKTTPNKKLSELFSGLATNISSGGELKNYLEKKAESFLTDYRLERQKYTALAGTFMDVYISILIAAPLIMMIIVMNVAGLGFIGLGIQPLMFLSVLLITIANVIFLFVLNAKQPRV
jgi:archaellum biogenesis protein FlaJ (TadC family)